MAQEVSRRLPGFEPSSCAVCDVQSNAGYLPVLLIPLPLSIILCGLVARVLGYRSGGPGSIPGTTRKKNSGSGTGCAQPREYN
jgi:hypothetical protein